MIDRTMSAMDFIDELNSSFNKDFKLNQREKPEPEVLKYLEEVLDLNDFMLSETDSDSLRYLQTETLYKLASQIQEHCEGMCGYNPFVDYPLCDRLEDFYDDYSELCAIYSEDIIDKSLIDLSDLTSLKIKLASYCIEQMLFYYKQDIDDFLVKNPLYEEKRDLAYILMKSTDSLSMLDNVEVSFQENENGIILLDSIKMAQNCREQMKNYLKRNSKFETESDELNEFLELDAIKEEILQEKITKLAKGKK